METLIQNQMLSYNHNVLRFCDKYKKIKIKNTSVNSALVRLHKYIYNSPLFYN